jgi:hypothetical protein
MLRGEGGGTGGGGGVDLSFDSQDNYFFYLYQVTMVDRVKFFIALEAPHSGRLNIGQLQER